MKACLVAVLCLLSVSSHGATVRWRNIYADDPGLAGVLVQHLPDNATEAPRWRGKHPAMILFVFWGGRVRQRGYSPDGAVREDFWWHITPGQTYIWRQLDYSKGSDPRFRRHADPRKNAYQAMPFRRAQSPACRRAANGWQPRFLVFHEIPPSIRSHAPPRQSSLILGLVRRRPHLCLGR